MLAPAAFNVGGRQFLVAKLQDGFFVGRAGLLPGTPFRPAKPGETVTAFGIGFGEVTPAIPPGNVVTRFNELKLPLVVSFGQGGSSLGLPAVVPYKGLAPSFVGLYQLFNIVVPVDLPDGDYQINMTLGGQALQQAPFYLTIQR